MGSKSGLVHVSKTCFMVRQLPVARSPCPTFTDVALSLLVSGHIYDILHVACVLQKVQRSPGYRTRCSSSHIHDARYHCGMGTIRSDNDCCS